MKFSITKFVWVLGVVLGLSSALGAQGRMGSIYNPDHGPINIIADKTARTSGDLVTVMIREVLELENKERTQLGRSTTLDYALASFNVKPNAFNLPLPDIVATSQDDFAGQANYGKSGSFEARITAIVMDVHPNGNLVVEGRREIRVDNETKVITFSGIVRRYDIDSSNTIQSELVADARVSYVGSGVMTDTTNRHGLGGWIHDIFAWVWPF